MDTKPTYSYDEAFAASLQYFDGDELAARVWVNKYAMKDSFGNIYEQSPADMHWRIANEIARIEQQYKNPMSAQEVFDLLDHFRYIVPAGSPMTGIGNDYQVASLSNCFVIGLDGSADSYGAVIKIDEEQVQLMKRRGGVGHDLSHIRPAGSPVKNSALTSTGIVPFMERYSNSTREVAQEGRGEPLRARGKVPPRHHVPRGEGSAAGPRRGDEAVPQRRGLRLPGGGLALGEMHERGEGVPPDPGEAVPRTPARPCSITGMPRGGAPLRRCSALAKCTGTAGALSRTSGGPGSSLMTRLSSGTKEPRRPFRGCREKTAGPGRRSETAGNARDGSAAGSQNEL